MRKIQIDSKELFVFYRIQGRVTHESPWLKPKGRLKRVRTDKWCFYWWDHICNPKSWKGNNLQFRNPAEHADSQSVYWKTGMHGWSKLRYAKGVMRRLQKASEAGKLNYEDTYRQVTQAVRYEFRIVKCYYHYSEEVYDA